MLCIPIYDIPACIKFYHFCPSAEILKTGIIFRFIFLFSFIILLKRDEQAVALEKKSKYVFHISCQFNLRIDLAYGKTTILIHNLITG